MSSCASVSSLRYRDGVRTAAAVAATVWFFGASFGLVARGSGMGVLAPLVMSATTFAGSAQFAAASILAGSGSALAAITAAVVGVVLNLALWFALHTLFGVVDARTLGPIVLQVPDWHTLDFAAAAIALGAIVATFRFHVSMLPLIGSCALLGVVWRLGFAGQ